MPWYNTLGAESTHALCTRITYLRNPILSFGSKADPKDKQKARSLLDSILTSNGFSCESFTSTDRAEPLALCERGFVPYSFATSDSERAAYFNEPCSLAVAVGGKSYLTVSALLSGISADECRNIASAVEELIDSKIAFAYSDTLGYLSPSPCEVGSGTVMSARLFLPSTELYGYGSFSAIAAAIGATLHPINNDGRFYSITYTPPISISEDAAISLFDLTLQKIVDEEKRIFGIISDQKRKLIIEKSWRAFGILSFAREIGEKELTMLVGDLRACLCLTGESDSPPVDVKKCNELLAFGGNNSLSASRGCKSDEECAYARADLTRRLLSSTPAFESNDITAPDRKGAEKKNGK